MKIFHFLFQDQVYDNSAACRKEDRLKTSRATEIRVPPFCIFLIT